ncbi:hypothetical protein SSX86_031360 [Deinandra increscens subsp. villosa]|uniref:Uncharacterized protein n=1 Tax=Deinandra increscens subsp. villosa TaxID=3103831 RepID=A0AAP0C5N8_9ASTR
MSATNTNQSSSSSSSMASSSQFTYSNPPSYFPMPFHLQNHPPATPPPPVINVPVVAPSVYPTPASLPGAYLPQFQQVIPNQSSIVYFRRFYFCFCDEFVLLCLPEDSSKTMLNT